MGELSGVKTLLLWATTPPIPCLTAPHSWGIRPIQALTFYSFKSATLLMLKYILRNLSNSALTLALFSPKRIKVTRGVIIYCSSRSIMPAA